MAIFRTLRSTESEPEPEYGLKQLHDSEEAEVDIVFVHGLGGSREATWTVNNVCWPQALLPQDLPKSRILTFGYDSRVVSFTAALSQNGIIGNAEDLCAQLSRYRTESGTQAERPIIFVAHSLGGLVCAQAVVAGNRSAPSDNTETVSKHIRGIVFLGTPFCGSEIANWVSRFHRVAEYVLESNKANISDLKSKSDTLQHLMEEFANVLRKRDNSDESVRTTFFYEQRKTQGVMVVDRNSAAIPGRGDMISIPADHKHICKFGSRDDEGYDLVLGALKKMLVIVPVRKKEISPVFNFNNAGAAINNQAGQQTIHGGMNFGSFGR
ncbi:esterase/lipase family protein [Aspergillus ibericus CBS 121593]|uniref:AB hydrolase-1 domain-containing protein n=1 Tax=Aspergillus ibericus CBS 121593 TaxID=1448316 RepID=A0A395GYQ1_9EURO|nr:hypothetical protein BO80DRAFT_425181 [Aspergillus ibericus CBS 121593]RAL00742.1 hypothetical protein BO80DRAFT_425181 [Aspergillus ibericus CBS 121593]